MDRVSQRIFKSLNRVKLASSLSKTMGMGGNGFATSEADEWSEQPL
jgi:hypothetical protein